MTDPMLRKLARQLVSVDKRVRDLETVPQLAHSSIDDGALPVYDAEGNVVAKVGKQDDGTWGAPPLQGPTPSAPKGVTATGGPGSINVAWTGEYERDAAPLDFDTLEVLVDGVLAGAIPNRDGGTVTIAAEQGFRFVAARIRTLVPRHSATTSPFSVEVGPPADQLFVEAGERIEAAEEQIQQGKDDLEAERLAREAALADAAQNLQDLADELATMPSSAELEAIRGEVATAQQAVEAAQADATAAKTAADNASSEAATAQQTADDAAASALAAAGIAADKGRIFYQATAPTGDDRSPNNLWIDSDDGRVYVWNGSAWEESQSEDLRDAAQAAVAAQQAAEAADSKAQAAAAAAAAADAKAVAADQKAQDAAAAAAAAQQTADDATLDARNAHNDAVAAQEAADAIRADMSAAPSIWEDSSFERGRGPQPLLSSSIARTDEKALTGAHAIKFTIPGTGGSVYGAYGYQQLVPGHTYAVYASVYSDTDLVWEMWLQRTLGGFASGLKPYASHFKVPAVPGQWTSASTVFSVPVDDDPAIVLRYTSMIGSGLNQPERTGERLYLDDFRLVDITDTYPQYLAAKQAADAAQARADEAYAEAASKPGMDEVSAEILTSANGKNAITVSASAPGSSTPGVVIGDTWWRVDGNGDIFGQWSWTGSKWSPRTIRSEVIANLDVGKLSVTGSSRFTTAVVDRLFADIFAAHKITASELVIAALDENGEIKPDSIEAVMIKDGQISANKILLLGDPNDPDEAALVATIASIMKLAVENLVVTDGATIDAAVIEKLAAQMITAGVIRTAETGQRVVIDQSGIVMYGTDVDGIDYELVRIGPSGENLITAGGTMISPEGVQAPRGTFDALTVGGNSIEEILEGLPRGVVAWGELTQSSDLDSDTSRPARRAELQTRLEPKRLYRISLSSHYLNTTASSARAVEELRYSFDYTPILPSDTIASGTYRGSQYRHYLTGNRVYIVPGQEFMLNTDNWNESRPFWLMWFVKSEGTSWPVQVVARADYAPILAVEDLGPSQAGLIKRWNDNNGGGSQDTTPQPVRYTTTWGAGGYGGDVKNGTVYQGTYSSYGNRYGGWIFSSTMRSALSGSTIEKLEVYLENAHWYYGSGGTARIVPNDGSYKGVSFGPTNVESPNWPRYAGRWVTIPSSWYPYIVNGTYKGVSTYATSTGLTYYGQFKGSPTKFRATYRK